MNKVFEAIRREQGYQDKIWGSIETNPRSIKIWIDLARNRISDAEINSLSIAGNPDITKLKLLQAAAYLVSCLEEHGVVEKECAHEWIMAGVKHDYYYSWRKILVYCPNCHVEGHIQNPSTHEYREAQSGERLRWYEPDRVVIQGSKS